MRIHRNHFFGLAAVLVGSLALASGCVVEDSDGSIADHPEGGSTSDGSGGSGAPDDGVGGTSDSGGEGGAAPTAGSAGTPQAAGGEAGTTPAAGGSAGAQTAGGAAGAGPASGGDGGAAPTAGAAGSTQAAGAGGAAPTGGAAGSTQAAGAGGEAGTAPCFGDNANGGFDCNDLPGEGVLCPEEGGAGAGGAGGAGGAAGELILSGIDLCISLASDGRPGLAEAFYNCVNEISPAECSTAYDDAVVACQTSVTAQACESSEATAACGRINCEGCSDILVLWSDAVIQDIESCYMDLRTATPNGDCLEQLKDAEAGIGCD